jgi:hypothetical protein
MIKAYSVIVFFLIFTFITDSKELKTGESEEITFSLTYKNVVHDFVNVIFIKETEYLSISEILANIKVYSEFDRTDKKISGFWNSEENSFNIDLNNMSFRMKKREMSFSDNDFVLTEKNIYFSKELIKLIFNLDIDLQMTEIAVYLSSAEKLPIDDINYRHLKRNSGLTLKDTTNYPLIYRRDQSIINGSFLNYSLGGGAENNNKSFSFSTQLLCEFLGGDLNTSVNGSLNNLNSSAYQYDLRWRYYLKNFDLVKQINAGRLSTSGLYPKAYSGVQITNNDIHGNKEYSEYLFKEQINPDWETEIYLNNELIGFKLPNKENEINYLIPLAYGTNNLELRQISPLNNKTSNFYVLFLPQSMLKRNSLKYSIDLGILKETGYKMLSGNANYGLTDYITLTSQYDYLSASQRQMSNFVSSINAKLSMNSIVSLLFSPGVSYSAKGSYFLSNSANIRGSYTHFISNEDSLKQSLFTENYSTNSISKFELAGYYRTNFLNNPLSINLTSDYYYNLDKSGLNSTLSFDYTNTFMRLKSFYKNNYSVSNLNLFRLNTIGLNLQLPINFSEFMLIQNTKIILATEYSMESRYLKTLSMGLAFDVVIHPLRINFQIDNNLIQKKTELGVKINYDFAFLQNQTTINSNFNESKINQIIKGSIAYSNTESELMFDKNQYNNSSSVLVRLFFDKNNNGRYDKDEPIIKNSSITLNTPVRLEREKTGLIVIKDLQPYSEYQISIDEASLDNPFWAPLYYNFAIETDPNQVKTIDVPFYESTPVEGKVFKKIGSKTIALSGIKVTAINKKNLQTKETTTFFDGGYYFKGLLDGEYQIVVNKGELTKLGLIQKSELIINTLSTPESNHDIEILLNH